MEGSITIDALKGGYVVSVSSEDGNSVEIVTTKSKAVKLVREALEAFEGGSEEVIPTE